MATMYAQLSKRVQVRANNSFIACGMPHTYQILQHSKAMAVQPVAPGFIAASIQRKAITAPLHAILRAIHSCNGDSPGLPTGVFSTIGPRLTRMAAHGRSVKSMSGGTKS